MDFYNFGNENSEMKFDTIIIEEINDNVSKIFLLISVHYIQGSNILKDDALCTRADLWARGSGEKFYN